MSELTQRAEAQRIQLAMLAGMVASAKNYEQYLPIPPTVDALPEDIWLDAISLAAGSGTPDRALRPEGLGAFGTSSIENNPDPLRLALSYEHGQALQRIASAVLLEAGRRPPRYIGQVLALDLPLHLLPQLRPWGIAALVVQVEKDGMYLSVRDDAGRSMAAAWWKAEPVSAHRTPLTYTPASWSLLHPICGSVWCDLRSEGIVLQKPDLLVAGAKGPTRKMGRKQTKKQGTQKIYLPPVRTLHAAVWGDAQDRRRIEHAVAGGNWYRVLQPGWEERERQAWDEFERSGLKPDILRRRELASQRAQEYQQAPPPPGFTYVRPFNRGGNRDEGTLTPEQPRLREVRAKGLFSLKLGLERSSIEFEGE